MSGKNSISVKKQERLLSVAGYIQRQHELNPRFNFTVTNIHKLFSQHTKAEIRTSLDYLTELELIIKNRTKPNEENIFTVSKMPSWGLVNSRSTDPASLANAKFSQSAIAYTHDVLCKAFGLPRLA